MTRAFVALGSNLDDPPGQLRRALASLGSLPDTRCIAHSRFYLTPPWGLLGQPSFVNAVAELDTRLAPHELLDALLAIEQRQGRDRSGPRWGPRTLDLDLLHMDGVTVTDNRLVLPHPRMAGRAFVLLPLADLAPELEIAGHGRVRDLLAATAAHGCSVLP